MKPRVLIVDESDTPIGYKDYPAVTYQDIYRITALWLTDSATGGILLAQRKLTKRNDRGKWSAAVAGTIEEDESYDENILHETQEEIGLSDLDFKPGPKSFIDDGEHKFFCQWYFAQVNKQTVTLTLQEEEVEAVQWLSPEHLKQDFLAHPDHYVLAMNQCLKLFGILD